MNGNKRYLPLLLLGFSGVLTIFACRSRAISKGNQSNNSGKTATAYRAFHPGSTWYDKAGDTINAHGGGFIFVNGKYYWFGEKRGRHASEGVNVYSSPDLYNWRWEALALAPDSTGASDIANGCLMERPKVIFNQQTGKYVMWFHLELKGQSYKAARAAVAVSNHVTGPYRFVSSFRPNNNMSRDMTLFVDDDGSAYQFYASRENYDLRVTKLSADYLSASPEDRLLFSQHREAPAIFKQNGTYYLVTSGCTGWTPNKATLHTSRSIWGPWQQVEANPLKGPGADSTFGGQSTFFLSVQNKKDAFIFIADRWNPRNLRDSRYLWLPVQFQNGEPFIEWKDEWNLQVFE